MNDTITQQPDTAKKTYRVYVWEEVGGYATVEASSREEARDVAQEMLDEEGVGGFSDFDPTARECDVLECKEKV